MAPATLPIICRGAQGVCGISLTAAGACNLLSGAVGTQPAQVNLKPMETAQDGPQITGFTGFPWTVKRPAASTRSLGACNLQAHLSRGGAGYTAFFRLVQPHDCHNHLSRIHIYALAQEPARPELSLLLSGRTFTVDGWAGSVRWYHIFAASLSRSPVRCIQDQHRSTWCQRSTDRV